MGGLRDHLARFRDSFLSSDHSHMPVNDMWVSFKSEVLEAIEQTLLIRQISAISNFSQLLHEKLTLKFPLKALAHSPPWVKSQMTLKGFSNC